MKKRTSLFLIVGLIVFASLIPHASAKEASVSSGLSIDHHFSFTFAKPGELVGDKVPSRETSIAYVQVLTSNVDKVEFRIYGIRGDTRVLLDKAVIPVGASQSLNCPAYEYGYQEIELAAYSLNPGSIFGIWTTY